MKFQNNISLVPNNKYLVLAFKGDFTAMFAYLYGTRHLTDVESLTCNESWQQFIQVQVTTDYIIGYTCCTYVPT